jgi:hypothetical protein
MNKKEEIISNYLNERLRKDKDFTLIKSELRDKHSFSEEDIMLIVNEISDRELAHIATKKRPWKFSNSIKLYPFLFLIFTLIVIGYSLYLIIFQPSSGLNQIFPYLMIIAALIIGFKHLKKLK